MRGGVPAPSDPRYCKGCLEKQQTIDRLVEEVKRLKDKLRRQERTALEEPFGASTPSSKRLVKPSSTPENRAKRGGAKPGHDGHGREAACEEGADIVEELPAPAVCPDCGCALEHWGERERTVHDCEPVRRKTRLVRIGEGHPAQAAAHPATTAASQPPHRPYCTPDPLAAVGAQSAPPCTPVLPGCLPTPWPPHPPTAPAASAPRHIRA